MDAAAPDTRAREGFAFALAAYTAWGLAPLFWRLLEAGPWEITAHRGLWGALALAPFALMLHPRLRGLFTGRRLAWALAGALLIASNWLVFLWAVSTGQVLEASLGYFIGPLVNVALGVLLLGERLRPAQRAAVLLAALGVAIPILAAGRVPVAALYLAVSFSLYAYVRKRMDLDAASGLFLETLLLAPACLAAILWFEASGNGHFLQWGWQPVLLVLGGGLVTSGVLLLFLLGARRLSMTALGLLQFLAPTIQFAIGLMLGEALPPERAAAFAIIWAGLALYGLDLLRHGRVPVRPAPPA